MNNLKTPLLNGKYESYMKNRTYSPLVSSLTINKEISSSLSLKRDVKGNHIDFDGISLNHQTKYHHLNAVTEPVSLSWHNIDVFGRYKNTTCFCIRSTNDEPPVHILKNVSGQVKPGQLLAIMGASGAGKTTLMNVLTARNLSTVVVKGIVKLNGVTADIDSLTELSSYVQQDDLFIGTLTVREHLKFQSQVRMGRNLNRHTRLKRVEEVISELSLSKCGDSKIGTPGTDKGISGGEMKRLAFASELLTNPSVMFCDEPTSGLDSFMAQSMVNELKNMASQGRTIVCTIHQPSSEVFAMFDHFLLMADGRVAFLGESGKGLEFFSKLGYNCPVNYNPADFYIQQLAVIPGKESECKRKINRICDEYAPSQYAKESMPEPIKSDCESSFELLQKRKRKAFEYKANWWVQFTTVIWRSFITVLRQPIITTVRIFQTLAVCLMLGLVYWRNGGDKIDQNGIMNLNGALFLLLTNMTFQNAFAVINTFSYELPVFLREHANGMYRVDVYFLAKMLAELPIMILLPIIFVSIYYFMVGFNSQFNAFITCMMIAILVSNCACSFGYFLSCACSTVTMALSISAPIMTLLILFGGFFLNNNSVPSYMIWLKHLSWFYYGNEALMINQWADITNSTITCYDRTLPNQLPDYGKKLMTSPPGRCIENGKMVLRAFNFDECNFWRDIFLLICLLISLRICAFIALLIRSRRR